MSSNLNRIRAGQIKDTDVLTESELAQLNPAYNIFLTKVGTTGVKVVSSASAPSALTVGDALKYNTANTSTVVISGSAGIYNIFAIGDDPNSKSFTIDFAASGQDPTGATNFRQIGSVSWDGNVITAISSLSDFGLVEAQSPTVDGQTVFTLSNIAYAPGTNDLSVYVNGSREALGVNYDETDSQTVTFIGSSSLTTADTVLFVVSSGRGGMSGSAVITTSGSSSAASVTYSNSTSGLSSTNVQTAIDEVVSDINALSTTSISEGSNLYFTDERAQDAVGNALVDSSTIDFTYNDSGNSITASVIQGGLSLGSIGGSLDLSTQTTGSLSYTSVSGLGTIATHNTTEFLAISGGTLTGDLILNADPSQALGAATKQYVDATASGLQVKSSVAVATTGNLTASYDNGSSGVGATLTNTGTQTNLVIDGHSASVNDRILVKDQTDATQNGIYIVTNAGSALAAWVLTRAADYDNSPSGEVAAGDFTFVDGGSVNAGNGFVQVLPSPVTIGTTAINFTQFSGAGQITAGTGLDKSGNTLSIDSSVVTLTDIQTLTNKTLTTPKIATISNSGNLTLPSGTNDTLVARATTDTLSNKTLDNSTVLTVKDANFILQDNTDSTKQLQFQLTGLTTGTTRTLTAPNFDGTIATLAGTETLTNKTLTSPTLTTPAISSIINGGTLTLPTSTDTLVGRATTDFLSNKTIAMAVQSGTGSSFTPDASTGNHFQYTLNNNTTINAPTNPTNGQKIIFELIQDATGSRTVTFSTGTGGFAFGSDITSFTATTTASKRDFVGATYNSTTNKWYIIAIVKGY